MKTYIESPFDLSSMKLLAEAVVDPGYGVFPNFLTPKTQRGLIQLMTDKVEENKLLRAGVGAGNDLKICSEIRSDSIFWIEKSDPAPTAQIWLKGMNELCEHFRNHLFLPLCSYEGHLARYPAEGFYKAHLDRHTNTLARQISVIAYLNENWIDKDGGILRLYTNKNKGVDGHFLDIPPQAGTVVIFRSSDFWHEVLPSKRARLSLTGWLRGREERPHMCQP